MTDETLKERCPTCGAAVASIFDHLNRDCENDEARAAGLPVGFSVNDNGALVIPDEIATDWDRLNIRGSFATIARFDNVITTAGRVLKSRDGDFVSKMTRAL
jgi:hypothetical protein